MREIALYVTMLLIMLSVVTGLGWVRAGFEAESYHRVTGIQVSQWDAMFLELRVDNK